VKSAAPNAPSRVIPPSPVMSFQSFTDVQKSRQGIDKSALTIEQRRRLQLKQYKETLLALADPKLVNDDHLMRLMSTGFGQSIGPYMRAVFPPQVTGTLQPHGIHVPKEYRLDVTTVDVKELPTPPHDWRDSQVRCGESFLIHPLEGPRIEEGEYFFPRSFKRAAYSSTGHPACHKHWLQDSGPYFEDFSGAFRSGGSRARSDPHAADGGRECESADSHEDTEFWQQESKQFLDKAVAQLRQMGGQRNPAFDRPQNEW
jgi:hypothetical protein